MAVPDFADHFDMIDNLPEEKQAEYHKAHVSRYGHREEYGGPGEDRGGRDRWARRPGKDQDPANLGVRGSERPEDREFDRRSKDQMERSGKRYIGEAEDKMRRLYAGDSAPRSRETFDDRYPGATKIKTSVWG